MDFENFTPGKTVEELDRYIVGQAKAKRTVAIALRNRWRRKQLSADLQKEIYPKNIIMIGPTGVGKTEIARRLSIMTSAPFLKVEATKYTEVGYVGRDVESMIRDLMEISINIVKNEKARKVETRALEKARSKLIKLLSGKEETEENSTTAFIESKFEKGDFDDKEIDVEVESMVPLPKIEYISNQGIEEIDMSVPDLFKGLFGKGKKKNRRMKVRDAFEYFKEDEKNKLINTDEVILEARQKLENEGIIFIDEMDKIAGNYSKASGPDVSREGVQRDLLPLVEGTKVSSRYGILDTSHILFIGAGAFNVSKPSDLIPELQGRFPLRVELSALSENDLKRILLEPKNSLVMQYKALLGVEGVDLDFTGSGIDEIAANAFKTNQTAENIGARRLFTIMEFLLEDISFNTPCAGNTEFKIDREFVQSRLKEFEGNEDLKKYIL